jgi:uncharacterized protein
VAHDGTATLAPVPLPTRLSCEAATPAFVKCARPRHRTGWLDAGRRAVPVRLAEKHRQIASRGGRAAHEKGRAHRFTPDEARLAGKKGGDAVSKDREHMAEIGRKGGERISQDAEHMAEIGRKGGEVASADRERMAQIGRKGGAARSAARSAGRGGAPSPTAGR